MYRVDVDDLNSSERIHIVSLSRSLAILVGKNISVAMPRHVLRFLAT